MTESLAFFSGQNRSYDYRCFYKKYFVENWEKINIFQPLEKEWFRNIHSTQLHAQKQVNSNQNQ